MTQSGLGGWYVFLKVSRDIFSLYSIQNARDGVQNDMIAEANRKRRKIERERRNGERPPPGTFSLHAVTRFI